MGGQVRDRKSIRREERDTQTCNYTLQGEAKPPERWSKSDGESRRGSDVITSRPSSPLPDSILKLDFGINLPSRSPRGQAQSHTHPSRPAFLSRNPFSDLITTTGQAHSRAPYSEGRVLRPEAGSGVVRTCSEKAAGRLSRRHGATIPTNEQVRAASGRGLGSARAAAPGARGPGDCHCGGRAFPFRLLCTS